MKSDQINLKPDAIKLQVNGNGVTLYFSSEPNIEAAAFIKKALISAYMTRPAPARHAAAKVVAFP